MTAHNFILKRLVLPEMAQASRIHRASFDDRLPWLKGLHTPQEDQWFYENCIFPQCEVWAAFAPEMAGIIAFKTGWIEQLYILPELQGAASAAFCLNKHSSHSRICNYGHSSATFRRRNSTEGTALRS